MVTTVSAYPIVEEQRYLALLRAANAIATSADCDCASNALVEKLKEVTAFDFIHVASFEKETNRTCWSLLEVNGKRVESEALDDLSPEHSPIAWVYETGQPLVMDDWGKTRGSGPTGFSLPTTVSRQLVPSPWFEDRAV